MTLYLPETLDIDQHLLRFPPTSVEEFDKDNLVYILNLILSIPATNKDISKKGYGWTPILSRELNRKIRNYKQYLDYALGKHYPNEEEAVLIITDNHYVPTQKAKWFAFNRKYVVVPQVKPVEIKEKALIKKLKKNSEEARRLASKQYPNLVKWYNHKLRIDGDAARSYVNDLLTEEVDQPERIIEKEFESDEELPLAAFPVAKYLSYLLNIKRIEEGDFSISIDSNVRRFHSNLTNLKSELRNFLTYDGKKLVSIDIKNSQPFLSTALFNPAFLTVTEDSEAALAKQARNYPKPGGTRNVRKFDISRVAPEIYEELKNIEYEFKPDFFPPSRIVPKGNKKFTLTLLDSLIMFCKILDNLDYQDVVSYKSEVATGMFYEYLQTLIEKTTDIRFKDRREVKVVVFQLLFTDNRYIGQPEAKPKRLFKELFPLVYQFFSLFKKKRKAVLPILLQSIESWLVLDKVCAKISNDRPDVPVFTIHDSIVTTVGNEGYVEKVMKEEIGRFIKVEPQLEISYYRPDNLSSEENK